MSEALANLRSLGTYEIVRKLGAGGMAEVFLAVQRMAADVERLVVVKSILPALAEDDRFVQMFLREARIAALLTHPNIVHIHDVAVIDKRPCIVMEFLRGRDLAFLLKRLADRGQAVEPVAAAALIAQAASGLDYAHQKRDERGRAMSIVHRDVSPHNLFVTRDGHVRVLDFGIAKSARQREQTETGTLKGKLAYMAPEYLRGQPVDGRADEFALGVVLWEALTGRRLFHRGEHFQTMEALFSMNVSPPSSVVPSVAKELDTIAMRALSRDPALRFATCEDMAASLRDFLRTRGAQSEAQIVARWLEQLAPVREDSGLYGANPSGATTTYARGELAGEPLALDTAGVEHSAITERAPRPPSYPAGSPPTKTLAPPDGAGPPGTHDALTRLLTGGTGSDGTLSRTDRIAGRPSARRWLVATAIGGVTLILCVAGAVWLSRDDTTPGADTITATPVPAAVELGAAPLPLVAPIVLDAGTPEVAAAPRTPTPITKRRRPPPPTEATVTKVRRPRPLGDGLLGLDQ